MNPLRAFLALICCVIMAPSCTSAQQSPSDQQTKSPSQKIDRVRIQTYVAESMARRVVLPEEIGIPGDVVIEVLVAKNGTVLNVRGVSGEASLIRATTQAVKKWVFNPYFLYGEPVQFLAKLAFQFDGKKHLATLKIESDPLTNATRGYWVDESTQLMWVWKDNGKDLGWKDALKYCGDLQSSGYSDWRLPTLAELGAIYDRNANAPGLSGSGKDNLFIYHVKGNLFLTGDEWSSESAYDDRGQPSGYSWYFDFNEGRSDSDPSGFPYPSSKRALCVRGPGK